MTIDSNGPITEIRHVATERITIPRHRSLQRVNGRPRKCLNCLVQTVIGITSISWIDLCL